MGKLTRNLIFLRREEKIREMRQNKVKKADFRRLYIELVRL